MISLIAFIVYFNWIDCFKNSQLKRFEVIEFIKKTNSKTQNLPFTNQGFIYKLNELLLIEINSFEQYFKLVALKENQLDVKIFENGKDVAEHVNETYYVGYLLDLPGSKVMGYINNFRFIGLIYFKKEIFHLDLLKKNNEVIMYRESDVIIEKKVKLSEPVQTMVDKKLKSKLTKNEIPHRNRLKRSSTEKIIYPFKAVACHIELIADHTFSEYFNFDINRIANEMNLQLMKANEIYQNTDFNQDGFPEGVSLKTAKIVIYKNPSSYGYTFANTDLDPQEVLNNFSKRFQNNCLAIAFLHRDFSVFPDYSGTLGLAWLATPDNQAGICGYPTLNERTNHDFIVSNVGLVTSLFRSKERLRAECSQTLAHEIGHLFGSRHDDGEDLKDLKPTWNCPSSFLMGSFASFSTNSIIFTDCSKKQIDPVLKAKSGCFKQLKAFCGNGKIEPGEECDCGPIEICHLVDICCLPKICLLKKNCRSKTNDIKYKFDEPYYEYQPFYQPDLPKYPNFIPNYPKINNKIPIEFTQRPSFYENKPNTQIQNQPNYITLPTYNFPNKPYIEFNQPILPTYKPFIPTFIKPFIPIYKPFISTLKPFINYYQPNTPGRKLYYIPNKPNYYYKPPYLPPNQFYFTQNPPVLPPNNRYFYPKIPIKTERYKDYFLFTTKNWLKINSFDKVKENETKPTSSFIEENFKLMYPLFPNKIKDFYNLFFPDSIIKDDSSWKQLALFLLFIFGPVTFFIWLLKDTCFSYRKKNLHSKKYRRRKRRNHI